MKPLTINQRCELFNTSYPQLPPLVVHKGFVYGHWDVGGGNVSSFYGSYQTEYLNRIGTMFPDCKGTKETVHLFSGSLPASPDYTRVGQDPSGQYQSDFQADIHSLSSFLPFKPTLILADPPYSEEDSVHYQNSMVDRARVVRECAEVLRPGGWMAWMDQACPVFSNSEIRRVGIISYLRSTGNRFRCVILFQKPIK